MLQAIIIMTCLYLAFGWAGPFFWVLFALSMGLLVFILEAPR